MFAWFFDCRMSDVLEFFRAALSNVHQFVPPQYFLLTVLYVGFLGSVLAMNVGALFLTWILIWFLKRK